jgi:hypothetical protein
LPLQNGQLSLVQTCWLSAATACDGSLTRNKPIGRPRRIAAADAAQQRHVLSLRLFVRGQCFAEVENANAPPAHRPAGAAGPTRRVRP